ncbi:hypothetical protein I302_106671 [Kwoniella bestiolae CBS 10118]|uniref:Nucleotide exchange factor Fes1 domain-containing protein n=1 Tax=Kwoniella bestiolae CBS 10118 TaxID=1296100 RepID=A0A1B9G0S1_9TREE|nr:hypothetical protein I302_06067 [Kwoniella bestiolae CBS 10118]OCF24606.1 hypothetical protein I302_06067 [Kwoniella bestiolae CBS 10118]
MPDLNELLKWSIANSTLPPTTNQNGQQAATQEQVSSSEGGLTIRYNPPSQATHSGTSALHPTDGAPPDLSPASTPGPGTPTGELQSQTFPLPSTTTPKRDDLTTEMLDLILGKSDSITMKEKMAFAVDEGNPVEERVEALDDFEMLIELIDNANNMPILKLWQPLLGLLSSPEPEIVSNALWIIGTTVQNNIKAQAALYIHSAFPLILQSYLLSTSSPVRAKAIYALSASLKHWPLASQALSQSYPSDKDGKDITGYEVLLRGLGDTDKTVRKKVSFLISTLVLQSNDRYDDKELPNEVRNVIEELTKNTKKEEEKDGLIAGLSRGGIFAELLVQLKEVKEDNLEFEENALKGLINALKFDGLSTQEKEQFKGIWMGLSIQQREERGLDKDEIASADGLLA